MEHKGLAYEIKRLENKINNPAFYSKAPPEVLEAEKVKLENCKKKLQNSLN